MVFDDDDDDNDAQGEHDLAVRGRAQRMHLTGSRRRLEALLARKAAEPTPKPYYGIDPIEAALLDHPSLTREEAEEMARAFGF